ncbi:hypothetical protein [Pedobacter miscanthi]|uniref:Uncharacterized protein n=1 Tax=Pedobacter miscanthi TaxID=2259170 RepID=A0A366LEG4_9SPHI|nr:hypothetical protein [Pedobacter miscanthi]RBQ11542.1 hypothetical protein DRW42_03515 [Pedobacter miscanthi]
MRGKSDQEISAASLLRNRRPRWTETGGHFKSETRGHFRRNTQLGIKVIYYIDPYPGISGKQILKAGSLENQPTVRLFNGAIGKAYHWLYEPIMSYKDELALLFGQETTDIASTYKREMESQIATINVQTEIINQLQTKIISLEGKLETATAKPK